MCLFTALCTELTLEKQSRFFMCRNVFKSHLHKWLKIPFSLTINKVNCKTLNTIIYSNLRASLIYERWLLTSDVLQIIHKCEKKMSATQSLAGILEIKWSSGNVLEVFFFFFLHIWWLYWMTFACFFKNTDWHFSFVTFKTAVCLFWWVNSWSTFMKRVTHQAFSTGQAGGQSFPSISGF